MTRCLKKRQTEGPTEDRTRISGFKVLCAHHYTMGPWIQRSITWIRQVTMQKSKMDCNAQDLDVWTQPRIYEEIHTLIITPKSRSWAQSSYLMSMSREFWFINWKIGLSINTVVINIIEWHILGVEENKRFSQTYIILRRQFSKQTNSNDV